jgi:hypothetical protein
MRAPWASILYTHSRTVSVTASWTRTIRIYEPLSGGAMRLVGVEFVVLASDWEHRHPKGGTPSLEGNLLNFVGAPNRYGLPPFYELHVWAWENNPKGSFADWNTRVSCDRQPGN